MEYTGEDTTVGVSLSVKHLDFAYPAYPGLPENQLFRDLSLNLCEGEVRIILGEPESGKTSLGRILCGLIPRYGGGTLRGTVEIDGTPVPATPPAQLIDRIGTVFQDPDEQIFTTSCEAETAFALESLGLAKEEIRSRVDRALEICGLQRYLYSPPASLSGGEKKRLLLAALFALHPPLWILDEPFEEIDDTGRRLLFKMMIKEGCGILILASKVLDIFDEHPVRYSLLEENGLLHEEDTGRNVLLKKAAELGLRFPEDYTRGAFSSSRKRRGKEERANAAGVQTGIPRTAAGTPLLSVRNLRFSYPGGFSLSVDNLDLYTGECIALIGPNGCGKTSLAKLLCGLLEPESGEVRCLDGGKLESRVAYMFQNPDYQIFLPSVKEELAYGLKEEGMTEDDILPRIREAAERFRLPALEVPPTLMSYGARKRLQGAIYYLLDRRVYIIDEADSGLSLRDFEDVVENLFCEQRSLVIITHDRRLGELFASRSLSMTEGKL
jgi:energy-coupling factor transport system ATP-binding protein